MRFLGNFGHEGSELLDRTLVPAGEPVQIVEIDRGNVEPAPKLKG